MDVRYRDRSLTIEIEAFGQALAPSSVRSQGVDTIQKATIGIRQ